DILPGGSRARQYAFRLPDGDAGVGQLQVEITADSTNAIFEFNGTGTAETNNTATTTVDATLAPYPDLVAEILPFRPASPRSGQPLTIDYDLTNAGDGPVSQSFHYSVQVVHVATGQSLYSRVEQYDAASAGAIGAGQARHKSATFTLPDGALGTGDLRVTV